MTHEHAASTTDGLGLLERALSYTGGSLRLVTPAMMVNATPCDGWDLWALLRHMYDSLLALYEASDIGHIYLEAMDADPWTDPVAALRNLACRIVGSWASADRDVISIGDRPMDVGLVTRTGAIEVVAHGWDVARACDADRPIPEQLAIDTLVFARLFVTDADREGRFAAPVTVGPDATFSDRLVGFLGRDPAWTRNRKARS